ncbi:hypothetical protein CRUP_001258 [Coryphaenoides rupestris]|nr:hypothetical protein CRUP_001258 [Coryphaenoides rupestris]
MKRNQILPLQVARETPCAALDEAPPRHQEEAPREEEEESGPQVTPARGPHSLTPAQRDHRPSEEQRLHCLVRDPPETRHTPTSTDTERELCSKRKECESLEHEADWSILPLLSSSHMSTSAHVTLRCDRAIVLSRGGESVVCSVRWWRASDQEHQLEDERSRHGLLKEESGLLRRKAQLLDQTCAENEDLREDLSEVTAQRNSVLEENQRLRAKLENLEQVIKAQLFAKREHEGVVQMLEAQLFAKREHEGVVQMLETSKVDLASGARLLSSPDLSVLTNGMGLPADRDVAAALRLGATPHATGLSRAERSLRHQAPRAAHHQPQQQQTELLCGGLQQQTELLCGGLQQQTELLCGGLLCGGLLCGGLQQQTELLRAQVLRLFPGCLHVDPVLLAQVLRLFPGCLQVDTASEVEELDIDIAPAPYTASSGAAKLQVFIGRYSYNPYDGPNDNPEVELPLTAGEYIYVYGDMDDDGFYEGTPPPSESILLYIKCPPRATLDRSAYQPTPFGYCAWSCSHAFPPLSGELMDGRRGLVPSNFVERVSDDDVMSAQHPETTEPASHNSLLDGSLHSSSHQQHLLHHHHHHLHAGAPRASERTESPSAVAGPPPAAPPAESPAPTLTPTPTPTQTPAPIPASLTNGLDLEEVGVDVVPYPRRLTLIKQLAKSVIIGWDPPLVAAGWGNVWSYDVFVDQELRLNVPFGAQTKAVLERLDVHLKAYRVSVQSLTERGPSDRLACSVLVGRDVCVAPAQLRVDRITATAAHLSWLPSNSNFVHIVSLNDEECELVKAGCYSLCLSNLTPSLQYCVKVEARPHRTPWELPPDTRQHRSATITFSTLMAGPPDAPLDVQLEQGPSPGIALVSWLPVTIDAAGTSNGVLEVSSPTAGSALLGPSQIHSLQLAQELTVRTTSAHGESSDSLPAHVPAKLPAVMAGPAPLLLHHQHHHQPPPVPYGNSAAKVSVPPCCGGPSQPLDALAAGGAANAAIVHHHPHAHQHLQQHQQQHHPQHQHRPEALFPGASYAEPWAGAPAAYGTSMPTVFPQINVTSPTTASTIPSPAAPSPATPPPAPAATPAAPPAAAAAPPVPAAAFTQAHRRDTESPGTIRPFPSISEFLEDTSAKLRTPEPLPGPPKAAPASALPDPPAQDAHPPLRADSTSPQEWEVDEEELENTRLVSMDDFLRQEPQYGRRRQATAAELCFALGRQDTAAGNAGKGRKRTEEQ